MAQILSTMKTLPQESTKKLKEMVDTFKKRHSDPELGATSKILLTLCNCITNMEKMERSERAKKDLRLVKDRAAMLLIVADKLFQGGQANLSEEAPLSDEAILPDWPTFEGPGCTAPKSSINWTRVTHVMSILDRFGDFVFFMSSTHGFYR